MTRSKKTAKPSLRTLYRRALKRLDEQTDACITFMEERDEARGSEARHEAQAKAAAEELALARRQDDEDAATIVLLREELAAAKEDAGKARASTKMWMDHSTEQTVRADSAEATLDVVWEKIVLANIADGPVRRKLEALGRYHVLRGLDLVIAKLHCSEAEVTKLELAAEVLSLGVKGGVGAVNTAPAENV